MPQREATLRHLVTLVGITLCTLLSGGLMLSPSQALAEDGEAPSLQQELVDALISGKPKLDVRMRWEIAKINSLNRSNAGTLRTRLGYGTRPWHGLSVYAEFENIVSFDDDAYFDGIAPNPRMDTVVADVEGTEINQGFLKWAGGNDSVSGDAIFGRQRISLDDARFIGSIPWRQNEQTFDAVKASIGSNGFDFTYGYLFFVRRIFGDNGAVGASTRDFDSNSHILNASYSGFDFAKITLFNYFLDFDDPVLNATAPANSSNSFGFRVVGKVPIGDDFFGSYVGSYAYQVDAGSNPTDYAAHYLIVEGTAGHQKWGSIGIGWEMLGSDGGAAQFRTPVATAHKFNGFADAFLDNGGAIGLRDLYVTVSPWMPCGIKAKFIYHHFESDAGNIDYGDEFDAVVSRKFGKYFTLLSKFAWYEGGSQGRADRYRLTTDAVFKF